MEELHLLHSKITGITQKTATIIRGHEAVLDEVRRIERMCYYSSKSHSPVLIGSRACPFHNIDLERDTTNSDWDVVIPPPLAVTFLTTQAHLIKDAWIRISPKQLSYQRSAATISIVLHHQENQQKEEDQGNKIEFTLVPEEVWPELRERLAQAPTCKLPTGDECRVASVTLLHVIKESHLHSSMNWEKHMADLLALRKHMSAADMNSRFQIFERTRKFKVLETLVINDKPDTLAEDAMAVSSLCPSFTFEGIDIRSEVANPANPQYYNFVVQPNILSRNGFLSSSLESQLSFIREEAITIAIHDSLISLFPFNDETAARMYKVGLKILCTTPIYYHWFTPFIINHYDHPLLSSVNSLHLSAIVEKLITKKENTAGKKPTDLSSTHIDVAPVTITSMQQSSPHTFLYFLSDFLVDDYYTLNTLSVLNKAWNSYLSNQNLWEKWYHKRWGHFVKGTNTTNWRQSYKKRVQLYDLTPDTFTKRFPLKCQMIEELKKYNQELKSGKRTFLNLRALISNLSSGHIRGEIKDLTGAAFVKELLPHTFIYSSEDAKVVSRHSTTGFKERILVMKVVLISQSAQTFEFTVTYTKNLFCKEYESGDSDYRHIYIDKCRVQIAGVGQMKQFNYEATEPRFTAVLFQASKRDCKIIADEFNCPKMKDSDLLQYLLQLLPPEPFSTFMEAVQGLFRGYY